MITVEEAEKIILEQAADYGVEIVPFEQALGRVLAENIKADRDMPPFNRVVMDGVAINFDAIENGISTFRIKASQAAGDEPVDIVEDADCIEIMTGAMLSASTDTVIRYEDLEIRAGLATLVTNNIKRGQNIHYRGKDKKQGDEVVTVGEIITPAIISLLASVGESELRVKKLPLVVIISTGNELVEIHEVPGPFQIRRSNNYTISAVLKSCGVNADMFHLPDNEALIKEKLALCLENYDVILLTGGVSMGKFDHIPQALETLKVNPLFHKVQQRPGKPFWFGKHEKGQLVFAFPGNPVATFMCLHRYFLPWLSASLGVKEKPQLKAVLATRLSFAHPLKYFLQVKLFYNEYCQLMAAPIEGNGSGDFANLADTDAFMELPLERDEFEGEKCSPFGHSDYLDRKMLSHVDNSGNPTMVDVGEKAISRRSATARSVVLLPQELMKHLTDGDLHTKKGPVFQTAIIAGIMAAKKTGDLIPLCHPLGLDNCDINISVNKENEIVIDCTATITAKTGVEMEALVGASMAALTIYDMCKAMSHDIVIKETKLMAKTGGKRDFKRA